MVDECASTLVCNLCDVVLVLHVCVFECLYVLVCECFFWLNLCV